ncbi:MAG: N-acetylmuramoyl-L-alanine amidase [Lachnospira eligens]
MMIKCVSPIRVKKVDPKEDADIINSSGADMVISIHQNSYVTPKAEGASVFIIRSLRKVKNSTDKCTEFLVRS